MSGKFFLIVASLCVLLTGCRIKFAERDTSAQNAASPRYDIEVTSPEDRQKLDQIRDAEFKDKTAQQIAYLKSKGHDIEWFDSKSPVKVVRHQTVQIIYFNYENYVIGLCSGSFVSNKNVATAGHCNHGILTSATITTSDASMDCRGRVLFAYKPSIDAEVQYFGCDQLKVQFYENRSYVNVGNDGGTEIRTRHWDLQDYALFSLPFVNGATVVRPEFQKAKDGYVVPDYNTLAIAVDPPKDGKSYSSKMDIILGKTIEATALFDGRITNFNFFVQSVYNFTESGNSGSPIYIKTTANAKVAGYVSIDDNDWSFVSSLFGHSYNSRTNLMVYTHPTYFADLFKRSILN